LFAISIRPVGQTLILLVKKHYPVYNVIDVRTS